MFQSVSGHSSEQSIALQLTANCIAEHPQPQRIQTSTVTLNTIFVQNSNPMASSVDRNRKFSKRIFSTPTFIKAISKLFGSQRYSDLKN